MRLEKIKKVSMENLDGYKRIVNFGYKIIKVKAKEFVYEINTKEKLIYIPQTKKESSLIEILDAAWEKIC